MSAKSAYYDSDDDVAWGPLTLREIKRTFREPCKRNVNRRHTIESRLIPEKLSQLADQTEVEKVTKMNNLPKESDNKINITGSSNEYYTPNVTLNHGRNVFLPNADSFYASCEETKEKNRFEDTHLQFLDLANRKTSLYLDNVQQTLIEESALNNLSRENNRSLGETEVTHDSCYMKSFNSSNSSEHYEEDNIIVLSSDDENNSFLTARKSTNNSFNNVSVKMEQIELSDSADSDRLSTENVDGKNESFQASNEDECEYDIDSSYQKSSDDDVQELSSSSETASSSETKPPNPRSHNSYLTNNVTVGAESPLTCPEFSPVQVPKIDLAAFDETEDCLELNNSLDGVDMDNTLERIERIMNASNGISSSSEGSLSSEPNSSNQRKSPDSSAAPVHIISGSFSQSPSAMTYRTEEITPLKTVKPNRDTTLSKTPNLKPVMSKNRDPTPIKTPNDKPGSSSAGKPLRKDQFVSKIAVLTPTNNFRVPKTPTPIKPKPTVLNCKKIVSPVGVYIKYSPKSPLMTHVKNTIPKKALPVVHEGESHKSAKAVNEKENASGLPPVVYRPARDNLYSVKENLFLPPSIEKLVKKSTLVKHEGRVHLATKNEDSIERKLEEETDLTSCTIRNSLLDESDRNVSVLASRQAFGK